MFSQQVRGCWLFYVLLWSQLLFSLIFHLWKGVQHTGLQLFHPLCRSLLCSTPSSSSSSQVSPYTCSFYFSLTHPWVPALVLLLPAWALPTIPAFACLLADCDPTTISISQSSCVDSIYNLSSVFLFSISRLSFSAQTSSASAHKPTLFLILHWYQPFPLFTSTALTFNELHNKECFVIIHHFDFRLLTILLNQMQHTSESHHHWGHQSLCTLHPFHLGCWQ